MCCALFMNMYMYYVTQLIHHPQTPKAHKLHTHAHTSHAHSQVTAHITVHTYLHTQTYTHTHNYLTHWLIVIFMPSERDVVLKALHAAHDDQDDSEDARLQKVT